MIVIVANKSDLFLEAQVTEQEGRNFAKSIGASFYLISCLQGIGIKEMVQEIGAKYLEVTDKNGKKPAGIDINKENKDKDNEKKKDSFC